jgi:hypothetical protein
MLHQVLRKFKAEGLDRKPGDIIETSGWKNERLLLEHRFLGKPSVPQSDVAKVVEGAHVEAQPAAGANSQPESPKATPTVEKVAPKKPPGAKVLPSRQTGKPAVLLTRRVPAVGKVPVAKGAG